MKVIHTNENKQSHFITWSKVNTGGSHQYQAKLGCNLYSKIPTQLSQEPDGLSRTKHNIIKIRPTRSLVLLVSYRR